MKVVNPVTLKIEEVEDQPKEKKDKKYVYVIADSGVYEDETPTTNIDIYETFDRALEDYRKKVANSRKEFEEWCDKDDIGENEVIGREDEMASFYIYEEDNEDRLYNSITIQKREVM